MGKPIVHEYDQNKTILKFFDYKGAACVVPATGVVADGNGRKIVKAGTPYPANTSACKGFLLHDVDVTQGDAPGTYIYEGSIDNTKIVGIDISSDAKSAVPRVTFFD